MERVVSDSEVWRKRAAVAEEAGQELASLGRDLRRVLSSNNFGMDCVEGEVLHERLRTTVADLSAEIQSRSSELQRLAKACTSAATRYPAVDRLVVSK